MGSTLAIHWAATTHGTWLHGDPGSSWWQGWLIGPDPYLQAAARAILAADAIVLDSAEQQIVAREFGNAVAERGYRIYAATVQATHVHLVFAPLRDNLTNVVARLKRRTTMSVLERRRLYSRPILGRKITTPHSLWTAGKFPIFIFDELHLANAIEYVRDHNRRRGLPADPFGWIEPLYPPPIAAGERCYRGEVNGKVWL